MLELKENNDVFTVFRMEKNIRDSVYNIFILLFEKNDKDKDIINDKFANVKQKLLEELISLNAFLKKLNDSIDYNNNNTNNISNNKDLIKYYDKIIKINKWELFFKEIFQRTDLINIMFKNFFNINKDTIIRKKTKSDRYRTLFLKNPQQIKNEKHLYKSTIEYILKNIEQNECETEFKMKFYENMKIEFLSKENNYIIYLQLPTFNVLLELPFDKNCILNIFFFKIEIIGKDEYHNKSYFERLECYKKNNKKLLFKKIQNLFNVRFFSLLNILIEEKIKNNPNIKNNINEYLIEIALRFIDYIYDYYNLFKIKCDICGKKTKYNPIEKCFFPPYYKLLTNKDSILSAKKKINEKNNEKIVNLFVHEECFKKIGLNAI